ncbi:MAG: 1-acyl-sn-glycerol-3-phosphate acyltransferase [Actinomycetota bacterium]|nr:1-acyl-sn-glycerol-3-phosphate acyltransferase [Actinomycetota bacterium]
METVYRPVIGLALAIFKVMGWQIRRFGAEHIPTAGPAVLASNHIGYLDFVFVGYAARDRGRLVRFMAKKEVFDHPVAGRLMRGMKHISVDRFANASDAIDAAVDALTRGEVVGMFPEGTISRSFVPRSGKTGAARMAMAAHAPLIPCATWGTQRILTKDRPKNFERNVAIDVYIGEPIEYEASENPGDVTARLMKAIGVLVEKAQGNYPQQPKPDEAWWLPAHMGGSAPTIAVADAMDERDRIRRRAERNKEA